MAHAQILATQEAEMEDCGSKPIWANKFLRPCLEKKNHKKGLVEWIKV
jgi:hypothetical protein